MSTQTNLVDDRQLPMSVCISIAVAAMFLASLLYIL